MSEKVDIKTRGIIRDEGVFHNNKNGWLIEDTIPNVYVINNIISKHMKQKLKLDLIEEKRPICSYSWRY